MQKKKALDKDKPTYIKEHKEIQKKRRIKFLGEKKNLHATVREKASTTYRTGLSHGTHTNGPVYGSAERGATGEKLVVSILHAILHSDSALNTALILNPQADLTLY